jgi:hypothetical protein
MQFLKMWRKFIDRYGGFSPPEVMLCFSKVAFPFEQERLPARG